MITTLLLEPQKEAKLIALVQERASRPDELVRDVIDRIIAAGETPTRKEPTLSLRGLLAKYRTAPSAEERV